MSISTILFTTISNFGNNKDYNISSLQKQAIFMARTNQVAIKQDKIFKFYQDYNLSREIPKTDFSALNTKDDSKQERIKIGNDFASLYIFVSPTKQNAKILTK